MKIRISTTSDFDYRVFETSIRLMQPTMIRSQLLTIDGIEYADVTSYHVTIEKAFFFNWEDLEPQILAKLGAQADTEIIRA